MLKANNQAVFGEDYNLVPYVIGWLCMARERKMEVIIAINQVTGIYELR